MSRTWTPSIESYGRRIQIIADFQKVLGGITEENYLSSQVRIQVQACTQGIQRSASPRLTSRSHLLQLLGRSPLGDRTGDQSLMRFSTQFEKLSSKLVSLVCVRS
jgi:hypothetical protein